jgi:ABC-type branched-subunit amino acid transport system substrate-binding protein
VKKFLFLLFIFFIVSCQTQKLQKKPDGTIEPFDFISNEDLLDNQQGDKLRVALLLPLSGKGEKIGEVLLRSAQLSMFNNPLNNIILMPYDTKTMPIDAVNALNNAIRDGADIVIGPFSTQETEAMVDLAAANNLIVLSLSDNVSLLKNKRPNLYLMGITPYQEMKKLVDYLIDDRNFYVFSALFPANVYGSQISKILNDAIKRKDAKLIKRDFYKVDDAKLKSKVDNILNFNIFRDEVYKQYEEDKPLAKLEGLKMDIEIKYVEEDKIFADAFLIPDSGYELVRIGRYYSDYNGKNKKPLLVGTSKWLNNNLYNNSNFNGAIFVAPNPSTFLDFQNDYYEKFQSYPLRIGALIYDAVTVVVESYAKSQDKENIRYAIENYQGFQGINGRFRFLQTGQLERKLVIIQINNGKYEIVDYDDEPFLKY